MANANTLKNEQAKLGFLIEWILICTIGWILMSVLGFGIIFRGVVREVEIAWILLWFIGGFIGGAIGGVSQWIFLWIKFHPHVSWIFTIIWVWSSIISYSLGFFAFSWILSPLFQLSEIASWLGFGLAFIGLGLTGIPQWLILRLNTSIISWWMIIFIPVGIIISLIPVFGFIILIVDWYWSSISFIFDFGKTVGVIGGVVFGLFTSVVLLFLDQKPIET